MKKRRCRKAPAFFVCLSEMEFLLHEHIGSDVLVVIMLSALGDLAHVDGAGGAELETAEALDAVVAEARMTVLYSDIALGTELCALTAGLAGILVNCKLPGLFDDKLGPYLALNCVKRIARRSFFGDFTCQNLLCDFYRELFAALLRKFGRDSR